MKKFPLSPRRKERGIALILVLVSLVLLSVLILAFLATTKTELQTSKFYANGSSVKLLAQSATDLVMGEIRDATQTGTLCWASQPGMIRTYDNTGSAISYYKLYSDGGMVGTGTFNNTQLLVPDGTGGTIAWYQQPGVYVDLNEPVTVNGVTQFPIVDGNSSDYTAATATMTAVEGIPASSQVIGPALASGPYAGQPLVAGFSLSSTTPVATGAADQAPMPVKWLYVLKDGSIAYPDNAAAAGTTTGTVTFAGAAAAGAEVPSANNPIVGRIAFWTDDETSKVNINTAGESVTDRTVKATTTSVAISTGSTIRSTVWDEPRAGSQTEIDLSRYQPAQNEFQRYPGHPATVSLSAVLGNLTMDSNFPECIFAPPVAVGSVAGSGLAPRLTQSTLGTATSAYWGGEVYSYVGAATGTGGSLEGMQAPGSALPLTARRFYVDTDELLFSPTLTAGVRTMNNSSLTATTELDNTMVRKTNFFLTAHSRAPDVNVFNQPRVCMWPLSTTKANWTANDQMIAFCSEIGQDSGGHPYPYFFQRQYPNDTGLDLPATLMTAGTAGIGNLNRNRNLLEYLRYLTSQSIPGFGGNFGGSSGKYTATDVMSEGISGDENDQILTEIFDYIRCTNIQDGTTGAVPYAPAIAASIGAAPYNPGAGQVVPIVDSTKGTRGFGRFPTIASVSLDFFALQNGPVPYVAGTSTLTGHFPTQLQAVLLVQMFNPSQAFPPNIPWYQIQVSGLSNLKWGQSPTSPMFAQDTATIGNPYGGNYTVNQNEERQIGGMSDFRRLILSTLSSAPAAFLAYSPAALGGNAYTVTAGANTGNLFSTPYPATPSASSTAYTMAAPAPSSSAAAASVMSQTFAYSGGPLTFKIYSNTATGAPNQLLQTINFTFPSEVTTIPSEVLPPTPSLSGGNGPVAAPTVTHAPLNTAFNSTATDGNNAGWQLWYNRGQDLPDMKITSPPSSFYCISFIADGDTIRSAMPMNGDLRLLAARQTVNQSDGDAYFFKAHPGCHTGVQFAHDLQDEFGRNAEWGGPCYGTGVTLTGQPAAIAIRGGSGGALVSVNSPTDTPSLSQPYGGLNSAYALGVTYYAEYFGLADTTGMDGTHWSDIPTQRGAFVGDANASQTTGVLGDWDNGMANYKDGAYINKADEGSVYHTFNINGGYFETVNYTNPGNTFFSPNREVPSAGLFGSLPTGVLENKPWRTLLFRPGPSGHPGLGTSSAGGGDLGPPYTQPPDHLFMDLFSMPVIEPYAISEPLSTAGRVNMNYQIVPFTYINRSTAVQAALRSVSIVAIPNTDGTAYKQPLNPGGYPAPSAAGYRFILNIPATLAQFNARFATQSVFRSPSEICNLDLVPSICATPSATPGTTAWRAAMDTFWQSYALTGDNTRERPYADLYPLLTTKSNTFTIHYRVQTLKPSPANASPTVWREGTDTITGEYRGSQTVERYIDPNDTTIPDFTASPSTAQSLAPYYRFRVVTTKQFAP